MLYATNPNILYLGITSMTEAPFMLFFVAAAYYFQTWYQNGNRLRVLLLCSVFLSLATLCRYEAWFLPIFLIIVVSVYSLKSKNTHHQKSTCRHCRNPFVDQHNFLACLEPISLPGILLNLATPNTIRHHGTQKTGRSENSCFCSPRMYYLSMALRP